MQLKTCTSRETLKKYLAGWIDLDESSQIEQHIAECAACEQTVVELERELVGFVTRHVPLPAGSAVRFLTGDARTVVEGFDPGERFDVIVLDIFSGEESPAHLATVDFYRILRGHTRDGGLVVVNLGDDAGMRFARRQLREMQEVFADVMATGEARLFTGRYPGNVVAVGGTRPLGDAWVAAVAARGPHPARALRGAELDGFGEP